MYCRIEGIIPIFVSGRSVNSVPLTHTLQEEYEVTNSIYYCMYSM